MGLDLLPFSTWRIYRGLMDGDAPVGMRTAHQQALQLVAAQEGIAKPTRWFEATALAA